MDAKKTLLTILLPTVALVAPAVDAHTLSVEDMGLLSGLIHPWLGLDHLLALLAVGLWARQQGGEYVLRLPLAFVLLMAGGTGLGLWGLPLPALESGLASSVLVLGLLLLFALRLPAATAVALVGMFALLHGYAHAVEIPGSASVPAYVLGLVLGSTLLQALSITTGGALATLRAGAALRFTGAAIAASGILLWG